MGDPDGTRGVTWGEGDYTVTGSIAIPTGGTPALVFASATAAGVSLNFLRADDTVLLFDGTAPTTIDAEIGSQVGTSAHAARRDHRHSVALFSGVTPVNFSSAASLGNQTHVASDDHVHKSQSSGDFYAETTGKGLVTKDPRDTPRYWRIGMSSPASATASGGLTLNIDSAGTITAVRDGGAVGTIIIRIDDTGTSAP